MKKVLSSILCILLSFSPLTGILMSNAINADIVVAKDGSGNFKTVQAAIDSVPSNNTKQVVIYIKNGTYQEVVTIRKDNLYLVGESNNATKITYGNYAGKTKSDGTTYGTSGSASFYLYGKNCTLENITIENSFDENSTSTTGTQAVAAYIQGDRNVIRNCVMTGNQDTLYANGGRQYYNKCKIIGDVDFIFGGATAVFDDCDIVSATRVKGGYITAASTDIANYGYLFLNCRITSNTSANTVYLGRPWRPNAYVVYKSCILGAHIRTEGWTSMSGNPPENARFFEYKNTGPGAVVNSSRRQLTDDKAQEFTTQNILKGTDNWDPSTSSVLVPENVVASNPDWNSVFKNSDSWFGSSNGISLADEIVKYQLADGGWRKDMTVSTGSWGKSTIDNKTTTSQITVLAKVYKQTNNEKYLTSCQKGIDLLLNGQYSNGGWPQVFNDAGTYHAHITYNDDAMIHVMSLLTSVSQRSGDFTFIDSNRAARASNAVTKGIQCILATQITSNGIKTAWCQQHDENTLKPTSARAYELPSTSSSESTGIVNYLKTISNPSSEIINSINSAVAWMKKVQLLGIKVVDTGSDKVIVNDSSASPIWARFYELGTNKPIFVDRDGSVHYNMSEISQERRTGYAWYGSWPSKLVAAGNVSQVSPTPTPKPTSTAIISDKADINGDKAINMADVIILALSFNTVLGDDKYVEACDLNNDGVINMADVIIIAAKFNTTL